MNDYYNQPTGRLENDHLILDYLRLAGPRIVRLIPKRLGENLLAEVRDYELPSPHGPLRLWGGHRLWHAPETAARTYVPDGEGLQAERLPDGARLTFDEPHTGIRKELSVVLHPTEARVRLEHRLTNVGLWPVELAPWGVTMMKVGGTATLPMTGMIDEEGLLPNRMIALWPYTRWDDPRLRLGEAKIEVDVTHPLEEPFKLGYMNRAGWLAYHYKGITFTKRFTPYPDRPHVDFGCNAEVYSNDRSIELETLGPLVRLAPGESVDHVETWEVEAKR